MGMFSIETKTWKCYHTLWKTFFLQTLYFLHSTIWSWVIKSSLHSRGERHAPPSGAWSLHIFGIKISLFSSLCCFRKCFFTSYMGILEMYLVLLVFETFLSMNIIHSILLLKSNAALNTCGTHAQLSLGNILKSGNAGLQIMYHI